VSSVAAFAKKVGFGGFTRVLGERGYSKIS